MRTPNGSPVILHVECGIHFLTTVLDLYGAESFNLWQYSTLDRIPMSWSEGEDEPPVRLWFDAQRADFAGMKLDGADLGLFDCERARFDGVSAVGTMFGDCPRATFRNANLREAVFIGDISGADFSDARLDGVSLADASFDPDDPPVGLPDSLSQTCRVEPVEDGRADGDLVVGLVEYPVTVKATIAESATR